jgi:hypothetical protein
MKEGVIVEIVYDILGGSDCRDDGSGIVHTPDHFPIRLRDQVPAKNQILERGLRPRQRRAPFELVHSNVRRSQGFIEQTSAC